MKMNKKGSMLDVLEIETSRPGEKVAAGMSMQDKQMVCLLVSIGEPLSQISRKLNIHLLEVEKVVKSDEGLDLIIRLQSSINPDPMVRVKKIANIALDAQLRILLKSSSDTVVAKVAQDVLDRACGKATQVIEQRNLSVSLTDMSSVDKALNSANDRLARLEAKQKMLLSAKKQ